jgi:Zn-dependent protease
LLPLPPLDGYRLIKFFFPEIWRWIDRNLFYLTIVFLILLFMPGTGDLIKTVVVNTSEKIFNIFYLIWANILFWL